MMARNRRGIATDLLKSIQIHHHDLAGSLLTSFSTSSLRWAIRWSINFPYRAAFKRPEQSGGLGPTTLS